MVATVEEASARDIDDICALDREVLGSPERASVIKTAIRAGDCLMARIDGSLAGYAIHDRSLFGRPFLALVIVHPRLRRQGVATALIRRIEAAVDGDRLFTSTNASNVAMRRLCRRLGFRASGRIENLDPGDPELIFVKVLR